MNIKQQAGFSVLQIVLALAFASIVSLMAVQQFGGAIGQAKQETATLEIMKVVNASNIYRQIERSYKSISIKKLADEGYAVAPLTGATAENVYGLIVSVAAAGGDMALTYGLPDQPACTGVLNRVLALDGYKSGGACSTGGDLSATFE